MEMCDKLFTKTKYKDALKSLNCNIPFNNDNNKNNSKSKIQKIKLVSSFFKLYFQLTQKKTSVLTQTLSAKNVKTVSNLLKGQLCEIQPIFFKCLLDITRRNIQSYATPKMSMYCSAGIVAYFSYSNSMTICSLLIAL